MKNLLLILYDDISKMMKVGGKQLKVFWTDVQSTSKWSNIDEFA